MKTALEQYLLIACAFTAANTTTTAYQRQATLLQPRLQIKHYDDRRDYQRQASTYYFLYHSLHTQASK